MMRKIFILAISILLTTGFTHSSIYVNASQQKAESGNENSDSAQEESSHFLNIGSVSKMYTVAAVMQLRDQGKIDLDAPLTEYIPEFKMADKRYKNITVRMLMNHTSGLMGSIYGGGFLFQEKSSAYHNEFLTLLNGQRLKYTPGEYNCYCNDGFTLLEILVERISGISFTDYLEKYICKPLSINHTGTMWNISDLNAQVPCYISDNIQILPECTQLIGAGGIMSRAEDVCAFGSSFFSKNHILLSEDSKNEMAKDYAAGISGEGFGLGWDQVNNKDYNEKGVTLLQKSGDTNFQHANLTVAPDEEISVAVLSSGGSSSTDANLSLELLDIALDEKGITITHPEKETPVVTDRIPDEYQRYEGLYANANMIIALSFPQNQYMLLRSLTNSEEFTQQYMYTKDGNFVKVSGDVESGNAIPQKPFEILNFEQKDGKVYVGEPGEGYVLEKVSENDVNDRVLSAWEERNGESYYYYNGSAADIYYCLNTCCITLNTNQEAKGYVNGYSMINENHAENRIAIPGSASRDVSDIVIHKSDGKEILTMSDQNTQYISEKSIPEFTDDITEIQTETKAAKWYKINGLENEDITFDIPKHAAVYVYDQYGNIKYTSTMWEYNTSVPLPEYGMIVFIGDTGQKIGVSR